jgi:hypothetical protein
VCGVCVGQERCIAVRCSRWQLQQANCFSLAGASKQTLFLGACLCPCVGLCCSYPAVPLTPHMRPAVLPPPCATPQAPGYQQIIKKPMDLSTIRNKVNKGQYAGWLDLKADLARMVQNALVYNQAGQPVHTYVSRGAGHGGDAGRWVGVGGGGYVCHALRLSWPQLVGAARCCRHAGAVGAYVASHHGCQAGRRELSPSAHGLCMSLLRCIWRLSCPVH